MKKNIIVTALCIFGLLAATETIAQTDSSFNYQGELYDNGVPANDAYDISINAFDEMGNPIGFGYNTFGEPVVDGLFNLDVFLGIAAFNGFDNIFLEISVRKSSVGGAYTILSPLQALQAVPLASNLTNRGATAGQILTFTGTTWNATNPKWTKIADIVQSQGDVAIGTSTTSTTTHRLTIKADSDDKAMRLIGSQGGNLGFGARLNFGDGDFVYLGEDEDDSLALKASRIKLQSHTQQPLASNGQIKFMVAAFCSSSSSSISRQYNGVDGLNSSGASITNGTLNGTCKITFPFDVSSRFYQVSAVEDLLDINAVCQASGVELNCARHKATTGLDNGQIMIMIY